MPQPDSNYRGARYFKCDLQVGTPADTGGWLDDSVKSDAAGAHAMISACLAAGIECIAVTDHNFASKSFIPMLQAKAKELCTLEGVNVVIFPGFEVAADVGKGVHVLAIFDPDEPLERIDHYLTECGIGFPRWDNGWVQSSKRLPDILATVQGSASSKSLAGLVILPHLLSNDGLFSKDSVAEWLQSKEFKNDDLLAVEVPKPVGQLGPNFQKLFGNGSDCVREWKRVRKIACIQSSDCKSIAKRNDGNPWLGSRYTWIKMSAPSIEALRQAFLDPDSRVRLQEHSPDNEYSYPFIRRISVKAAAFLTDMNISFSKNLNSIIGGRGSGKSTLIEYIRSLTNSGHPSSGLAREANTRAMATLERERCSLVTLEIERDGEVWEIGLDAMGPPRILSGSSIDDIGTFFPVEVYSQGQLHEIAESQEQQRKIIEGSVSGRLDDLRNQCHAHIEAITKHTQNILQLTGVENREAQLRSRLAAAELRVEKVKEVGKEVEALRQYRADARKIDQLKEAESRIVKMVMNAVASIESSLNDIPAEDCSTPGAKERLIVGREKAKALRDTVRRAGDSYIVETRAFDQEDALSAFKKCVADEEAAYEKKRSLLVASGADPDELLNHEKAVNELQLELKANATEKAFIERAISDREQLLEKVENLWREEYRVRLSAIEALNARIPSTGETGKKIVEVSITLYGDLESTRQVFRSINTDGRSLSTADLEELADAAHAEAMKSDRCPTFVFKDWIAQLRAHVQPDGCPWGPDDRKGKYLVERLREINLWSTYTYRPEDSIEVKLFRGTGELVGTVAGDTLSTGQRCTALLSIILAATDNPIIIDQPEDDLDNQFIYAELVPLLRLLKERRQLIVATHNANLPVNADSENVIALEVRDGRGCICRCSYTGSEVVGGMDRPGVQETIGDIMEGSEEAFRRRQEKYGY